MVSTLILIILRPELGAFLLPELRPYQTNEAIVSADCRIPVPCCFYPYRNEAKLGANRSLFSLYNAKRGNSIEFAGLRDI